MSDTSVKKAHSFSRRTFLSSSALTLGFLSFGATNAQANVSTLDSTAGFLHGVASGDPLPDSVIIWTRLTPDAAAVPGSGLGAPTRVRWEVSAQAQFSTIIAAGEVTTSPDSDHTVKINVTGLAPATTYFYRFSVVDGALSGTSSPVGRTRTAPAAGATPQNVRFGVVSCSNIEAGYFLSYRELAARNDVEFIIHLGDYTYEYESGKYTGLYGTLVRPTQPPHRTTTLQDYRVRLGHYRRDVDLCNLHAAKPMISIWDDHEFADNAYRDGFGGNSATLNDDVPAIKAAATQAYYEWMPVRTSNDGANGTHLYRHLQFGSLVELILPDLRTYRDRQLLMYGKGNFFKSDPDFLRATGDPQRSALGETQFAWLSSVLESSATQWQAIGNSVMISPMTLPTSVDPLINTWLQEQFGLPSDGLALNQDQWDGFMAERQRLVDTLRAQGKNNVVFLTGDIHSSWASAVPANPTRYRAGDRQAAATEFVAPSVTASNGYEAIVSKPGTEALGDVLMNTAYEALRLANPWHQWIDMKYHGFMVVDFNAQRTQCDWFFTNTVLENSAQFYHARSYQTLAGAPGPVAAPAPLTQTAVY
ncbi:phosphodiesterase [Corynebacterium sp. sy017]|uniref:alkaline phosphatase D family protein n=1 Tax=unclassified Corynebacterium TaxID=2624378 RepID=UPI0011867094|nr:MULTISPECIES: alkaline phosphatase D family protein [unclassified Corynebacterium]MBP3088698.1 phosphodiesterase [Corynebacterium sp. sy017]TSD91985.1 phosphodiesterase [Corynebacterium sp. SY003]